MSSLLQPHYQCGNLLMLLFFFLEQVYLTKVNRNVTVSKTFNVMAIFIFLRCFYMMRRIYFTASFKKCCHYSHKITIEHP